MKEISELTTQKEDTEYMIDQSPKKIDSVTNYFCDPSPTESNNIKKPLNIHLVKNNLIKGKSISIVEKKLKI